MMSLSKYALTTLGVTAVGFSIGMAGVVIAQRFSHNMKADSQAVAELGNNEGVYVDRTTFKLHMGKPRSNATPETLRKGAQEVSNGAIIFRSDGKLYIVDAKPGAE